VTGGAPGYVEYLDADADRVPFDEWVAQLRARLATRGFDGSTPISTWGDNGHVTVEVRAEPRPAPFGGDEHRRIVMGW
jgi:hypothetical protein